VSRQTRSLRRIARPEQYDKPPGNAVAVVGALGAAALARRACTAYTSCMQYTIRNIPKGLDALLRRRAREEQKTLNQVALEGLLRAFGLAEEVESRRDLTDIAGTWDDDPAVEAALADQRAIDEDLWT